MSSYNSVYQYYDYDPDATKAIQEFYVPIFEGKKRVLDLACGRGEFLELLLNAGIGAVGVDGDADSCSQASGTGAEVVNADIVEYLKGAEPGSFDGIFMSHLVEHLSFEAISEVFASCRTVLADSGVLVVSTPSVSSVGMHLDWFYRDPTHAGWRHPQTLGYFLTQAGFDVERAGGNSNTSLPYLGRTVDTVKKIAATLDDNEADLVTVERQMAEAAGNQGGLRKVFSLLTGRRALDAQLAIARQGYIDRIRNVNEGLLGVCAAFEDLAVKLDASFEDYVVARKKA